MLPTYASTALAEHPPSAILLHRRSGKQNAHPGKRTARAARMCPAVETRSLQEASASARTLTITQFKIAAKRQHLRQHLRQFDEEVLIVYCAMCPGSSIRCS